MATEKLRLDGAADGGKEFVAASAEWSDTDESESEDESEVFCLLRLFGDRRDYVRFAPRLAPPPEGPKGDMPDDDSDSDEEMTEEQRRIYSYQLKKSDGFDVEANGVSMFGQIHPMPIEEEKRFVDYDMLSQKAVNEYNNRFKDANRELEFVKVLKVMGQAANGIRFYITFEAKDLADGGQIKIYQAVVLLGVGANISVSSFRLKPPEDEQGTCNHGKKWLWEDHLC